MTRSEALAALDRVGYSGRSGAFLLDVLWHAGWFLRRQYLLAVETKSGGNDERFLSRLLAAHAKRLPYAGREFAYHVHAKALYQAVGHPNSRRARTVSDALRAERLMMLDFVLAHPRQQFIVGEVERVQLFLGAYRVPLVDLPHISHPATRTDAAPTQRFFPERFPIFLSPGVATVSFVFPQVAYTPYPHAFETFLRRYRPLFQRVPACEVVYVYPRVLDPTPAQRAFQRFVRPQADDLTAAVHRYFSVRRRLELSTTQGLQASDLQQYHRDAARAQAIGANAWYATWLVVGRRALPELVESQVEHGAQMLDELGFRTVEIPHDYAYYGTRITPSQRRFRGDGR
jgi:hypothetical protein